MNLYDLIAEFRRTHPTTSANQTLDLLVKELGRTRDNLRQACLDLRRKGVPPQGEGLLEELLETASRVGLDDLDYGSPPPLAEPAGSAADDDGSVGIAVLLGGSALLALGLTAAVVVAGLNAAFHLF